MNDSRLPADVKRLGWVSFFTDISSEMLYAITPIFLTSVLGASAGIVGVIEGIAEATASILKGLSGWYSDRIRNRKRFIFAGYTLSAVAKPLIAVASSWLFVLIARFLDRFGKGVRGSARDALIADVTPKEQRGRAFGLHRAMDTAGALIGVVISYVILQSMSDSGNQQILLRNLYWLAFFPAILGVGFIFFVRESKAENAVKSTHRGKKFGKQYWLIVAIAGVAYLGFSSDAFLILKAKDIGLPLPQVLLAYIAFNAVYSLAAYPVGKISDKMRMETLLAAGLLIYGGVYFGFASAETRTIVFVLFICYGLYAALTDGVVRALIANVVSPDVKATALGLFSMLTGLLALAASLLAGWLWDNVSSDAPFLLGAILSLLASAGFAALSFRKATPNL
ncbi:MAG: MFS transporter [Calditrichaeota bacterium]|nr:MFS transporter [Calditrichota bacterium]MCB9368960.1 MFS transporter [Calditrichota bacterium]